MSARAVVSSKRCFSNVKNTAAANTRTGDFSSYFKNASSVGVGKILILQYFTISILPSTVVAGFGGGGGVERGETNSGGRTNCNVGGTAAARTSVSCSGAINVAISAMPRDALAKCLCASARSEKIIDISLHVSLSGGFWLGSLLTMEPRICSKTGTERFSVIRVGLELSEDITSVIRQSSFNSLSLTDCSTTFTSAVSIFGQMWAKADLYDDMKFSYAVARGSPCEEISSSKRSIASLISAKNLMVLLGRLAALDTGAVAIFSAETVIKLRIHCFDLRTRWYSHQSNKLINRLVCIRDKNHKILKFGRRHLQIYEPD